MKNLKIALLFISVFNISSCFAPIDENFSDAKKCYQNEFGSGDARDFEVITINIDGESVDGDFNWLPAYKDRRVGHFSGKLIHEGLADVYYTFYQEGKTAAVRLSISYNEHEISVKGGDVSMGLERKLPGVNCLSIRTP